MTGSLEDSKIIQNRKMVRNITIQNRKKINSNNLIIKTDTYVWMYMRVHRSVSAMFMEEVLP